MSNEYGSETLLLVPTGYRTVEKNGLYIYLFLGGDAGSGGMQR
jgi:hypothetical protein